ncbi:MAG: tetratricopeptide repeat protein [Rikenellaceae bacterium]|jgi:tetratricopeptide (TPR) repeat protein|nr:tetratricopeptide repeat protein [Rikenellaceae bacterium]
MRKLLILSLLAALAVAGVSAQKYPERRIAREGNRLYEKGDFEHSEVEYRRALEANPKLDDARFNLAGALFKQQKTDEAAQIYAAFTADSLSAAPLVSEANYNLGNVMLSGQKIDEAIELYKQALRLNPTDQQAKYNLAYAQAMKQQQENQQDSQDQQDQNEKQNQDNKGGEGDQDQQQGEGQNDQDQQQDEGDKPQPSGGEGQAGIDPNDAEQMLEAIQGEEDKTREKLNAKEVQGVARSGKNW